MSHDQASSESEQAVAVLDRIAQLYHVADGGGGGGTLRRVELERERTRTANRRAAEQSAAGHLLR